MARSNGYTEAVRVYAKQLGRFRVSEAARVLGLTYQQARSAVDTLMRSGEVRRVEKGIFEWVNIEKYYRPAKKTLAVWKAMRMSSTWTVKEVSRLAGTTENYVHKLIRLWRQQGLIERVGQRKLNYANGVENIYRLKNRSKLQPPVCVQVKDDPLKNLAWKALGRILLGKVVLPGEREQTVKELKILLEKLDGQKEI